MTRHRKVNLSEAIRLRNLGYTLDRIAQHMKVTRQAIIQNLKKAENGEVGVGI